MSPCGYDARLATVLASRQTQLAKGAADVIGALKLGLAGVLVASVMGVGTASAKEGDIIKTGTCSGASTWKLKLSPENGKIEVDFEVDQNVVGDTWRVSFRDNGVLVFRGSAMTQAPSGSFEVRKVIADRAGPDNIVAKARNLRTDEVCRASATF
jgi:hypothetical protein